MLWGCCRQAGEYVRDGGAQYAQSSGDYDTPAGNGDVHHGPYSGGRRGDRDLDGRQQRDGQGRGRSRSRGGRGRALDAQAQNGRINRPTAAPISVRGRDGRRAQVQCSKFFLTSLHESMFHSQP